MVHMNRFEYRRERALDEQELDDLGHEGWELVALDEGVYIFKRSYAQEEQSHLLDRNPSTLPASLSRLSRQVRSGHTAPVDTSGIPAHLLGRASAARKETARRGESRGNLPD